ncbi:MAG: family 20 glycosylhydrolase [Tannerellaceae bacterium]|jgi:hypothetical protein|nr:family 20 glycosylhydrolase [Tannerellaceae bacterium]
MKATTNFSTALVCARNIFVIISLLCLGVNAQSASRIDSILPVRGLAISAPGRQGLDAFINFIEKELAPAHFNLLILRVDWGYAYESHPELRDENPLTNEDVKKLVAACRKHGIDIAPQINLLGHQSWAKKTGNLLRVYPELDETPHVHTENYDGWPNPDGLYCKSYCPLHPNVHKIVFALIDEITEAFETKLFHAGMDEVFYIGDSRCPRCSGRDKAELFAGEVTAISNHLALRDRRLMIWGDRLIDGKTTGIGEWEASYNNTHRAVDMIPRNVFICDWHYERPDKTPVYFAAKGLDVAICPWRKPAVALDQLNDMISFRKGSTGQMRERFRGLIATVWSGNEGFVKSYYENKTNVAESDALTLRKLIEAFKNIEQGTL